MDNNVYYHPEKHGLTVVGEVEYSDGSYVFDTRVVWKHTESGKLYTARDAGCSCPTPFENYNSLADLEIVDYDGLAAEVKSTLDGDSVSSPAEAQDFLKKVRDAQ